MKRAKAIVLLHAFISLWVLFTGYAVKPAAKGTLYWDEVNNLSWDNFQNVQRNSNDAAMSSIAIESHSIIDQSGAFINIRAAFNQQKSWVKNDCKTAYILNHEQMHYNIVELYARKLRKALAEATFTKQKFSYQYTKLFNNITADHEAFQERYDEETNHSILQPEQAVWDTIIMNELESLEEYAAPIVKLRLEN